METLEGAFDWIDKRKISTLELKETQRFLEDACELMGVELVIVPAEESEDGK